MKHFKRQPLTNLRFITVIDNFVLTKETFFKMEHGAGEPLILVHGSTSDYRTWQVSQEELSKSFRTMSYSRRYHWPNQKIAEGADYSMAEHVDDLKEILKTSEFVPAHIVGHSYRNRSVARIRGLENRVRFYPGAYAPGFMLPPASQA